MQAADDSSGDEDITSPLLGSRVNRSQPASPYTPIGSAGEASAVVELPNVYRSRWRSIRVMYLTMFLGSVTFTITMSSLWPFLQVLNPSVSASFLGWVVASYSLGQLIASPFFGGWANLRMSSKEPLAVSLTLTTLSNFFYMYLQSLPSDREYYMILARGLIGFSAGNVAVVRSYVSGATTVTERTGCMANVSIFQAMGFILGPVIQAALVPVAYPGPSEASGFHFNMYTAPAFFAVCVALVNLLLLIFVFKEHQVFDDDVNANVQEKVDEDPESSKNDISGLSQSGSFVQLDYKPDYVAVIATIFLFFVVLFMFTIFETIGTPLTMHMYAWTKSKATLYQGIILGSAGCLSIVVFIFVKILAKRYNERYLLLAGFIFCFCGYFLFIPWGKDLPPRGFAPIENKTHIASSSQESVFALFSHVFNDREDTALHHSKRSSAISSQDASPGSLWSPFVEHFGVVSNEYSSTQNHREISFTSYTQPNMPAEDHQKSEDTLRLTTFTPTTSNGTNNGTTSSMTFIAIPSTTGTTLSSTTVTALILNTTEAHSNTTVSPEGCPWNYDWCGYVPVIHLAQYLGSTLLISIGYPMCNMLTYTIYSKVLGPRPQGLWMGWLTAAGSLARTIGPVYVSQVYDSYGPQVTFGSCAGLILATIGFFVCLFRRLVPFTFKDETLTRFAGSVSDRR